MPQSLMIGAAQGAKRQRSADGRLVEGIDQTPTQNEPGSNADPGTAPSKPNVRMPPYLEKTRSGKLTKLHCCFH